MKTKMCPECRKNKTGKDEPSFGAYFPLVEDANYECRNCKSTLIDIDIDPNDYYVIVSEKNTIEFLEAMLELKERDLIEYQLKISQFRKNQTWRQEATDNKPKCPRCKSTSITAGQRGYSLMWGFFGSANTVNRCANCGHKWKP